MRYLVILVVVLLLAFFYLKGKKSPSCLEEGTREGDGNVITQERTVSSFKGVSSTSIVDVILEKGDAPKVVVETDSNLMNSVQTQVRDEVLRINIKGCGIEKKTKMKVYVTYTELSLLETCLTASIEGDAPIEADELSLRCSDASKMNIKVVANKVKCEVSIFSEMRLSGKTTILEASSSSFGRLNLFGLESDTTYVDAFFWSKAKVVANKYLEVNASYGGNVDYRGAPLHPKMNLSIGGSARQK